MGINMQLSFIYFVDDHFIKGCVHSCIMQSSLNPLAHGPFNQSRGIATHHKKCSRGILSSKNCSAARAAGSIFLILLHNICAGISMELSSQ